MAENSNVTAKHDILSGANNTIGTEISGGDSQSANETTQLALTSSNSNGETMGDLLEPESDQKAEEEVKAAQAQESEKTNGDMAAAPVDPEPEVSEEGVA